MVDSHVSQTYSWHHPSVTAKVLHWEHFCNSIKLYNSQPPSLSDQRSMFDWMIPYKLAFSREEMDPLQADVENKCTFLAHREKGPPVHFASVMESIVCSRYIYYWLWRPKEEPWCKNMFLPFNIDTSLHTFLLPDLHQSQQAPLTDPPKNSNQGRSSFHSGWQLLCQHQGSISMSCCEDRISEGDHRPV